MDSGAAMVQAFKKLVASSGFLWLWGSWVLPIVGLTLLWSTCQEKGELGIVGAFGCLVAGGNRDGGWCGMEA